MPHYDIFAFDTFRINNAIPIFVAPHGRADFIRNTMGGSITALYSENSNDITSDITITNFMRHVSVQNSSGYYNPDIPQFSAGPHTYIRLYLDTGNAAVRYIHGNISAVSFIYRHPARGEQVLTRVLFHTVTKEAVIDMSFTDIFDAESISSISLEDSCAEIEQSLIGYSFRQLNPSLASIDSVMREFIGHTFTRNAILGIVNMRSHANAADISATQREPYADMLRGQAMPANVGNIASLMSQLSPLEYLRHGTDAARNDRLDATATATAAALVELIGSDNDVSATQSALPYALDNAAENNALRQEVEALQKEIAKIKREADVAKANEKPIGEPKITRKIIKRPKEIAQPGLVLRLDKVHAAQIELFIYIAARTSELDNIEASILAKLNPDNGELQSVIDNINPNYNSGYRTSSTFHTEKIKDCLKLQYRAMRVVNNIRRNLSNMQVAIIKNNKYRKVFKAKVPEELLRLKKVSMSCSEIDKSIQNLKRFTGFGDCYKSEDVAEYMSRLLMRGFGVPSEFLWGSDGNAPDEPDEPDVMGGGQSASGNATLTWDVRLGSLVFNPPS